MMYAAPRTTRCVSTLRRRSNLLQCDLGLRDCVGGPEVSVSIVSADCLGQQQTRPSAAPQPLQSARQQKKCHKARAQTARKRTAQLFLSRVV
eukprot:1220062-Rhodomonas_salina.1